MDSCSDETAHVIYLHSFKKDKKYKEEIIKEIIAAICAMLNSNGGTVMIHFNNGNVPVEDSSKLNIHPGILDVDSFPLISVVVRILDQSMMAITGIEETRSKVHFKQDEEFITISIKRADSLITTNYNLYSPSQTQVVKVPPSKPLKEIKDNFINRKVVLEPPVQLGTHCRKFLKNKKCGFDESAMCQLKNLKAAQSECTTLADRMTCKGNKFSCYVSAFACHRGGHIYYGIIDDTKVVEGEKVPNERSKKEITKKVEKAISKIIWPEQIGQPRRGEQWEIFFEPVLDENSVPVPSTFVIVIYIAPCQGGVFAEEPECYEMVKGKVQKMSFAAWKERISKPVWLQKSWGEKNIPQSVQLIAWSSDAVRKAFTIDCDELRRIVSNGIWEIFENECDSLQNESALRETMKLLILFKHITACNRKGELQNAHKFLEDYKALSSKAQDSFIFEVLGLYLEAALKRAGEDFKGLKELLMKALEMAKQIEPGLVTATVYIFAATVSDLIDLESPAILTEKALEHLQCVPDSSDVLAAMRRKANIILATFHLGCNVSGQLLKDNIDDSSLEKAMACIKAIYESVYEEHPLSVYYDIQLYLVLSIFKYRRSQLVPGLRERELRNACRYAKKAQRLAHTNKFTEMFKWSKNIETLCTQALNHVRNHKSDQKSKEKKNQRERAGRGDRVEQDEGNDRRKSWVLRNRTEQVSRQDQEEQNNRLESSRKKSKSTDSHNVKTEVTLLCAEMEATPNNVQESKAQDSSDKEEQSCCDSVSLSGRQKELLTSLGEFDMSKHVDAKPFQPRPYSPSKTATHQNSPTVSLGPTQPETSSYITNNEDKLMHVPCASGFEGSVSSSGYTGTSPIGSQRFSDSSFSFDQFPNGSFQVQVPVQQLRPSTYPAESTHRAQVPNYPIATFDGYQPVVLVNHPGRMMMRPLTAGARGHYARFPLGMPEPIETSPYQRFSRHQQWPASQLQQLQQTFGNPQRYFFGYEGTINQQRPHNKRRNGGSRYQMTDEAPVLHKFPLKKF